MWCAPRERREPTCDRERWYNGIDFDIDCLEIRYICQLKTVKFKADVHVMCLNTNIKNLIFMIVATCLHKSRKQKLLY